VLIEFSFGLFYFFEHYEFKEDDSLWDIVPCNLVEVTDISDDVCTSEMLVSFYKSTWHNISEGCRLHTHCRENLLFTH
jgi:hypothetical protein